MSIAKELLNLVNEDENNRLEKKLEDNEYFELNDILQSFKKENAKEVVKENIKEVLDREGFSFKDIEVRIEKITESALLAKVKITLKDGTVFNGNVVSSIQVSDDEEEYEMVDLQLGTEDFSYFGESNQSSFSFHGNKEEFDSRMRDLAEKTNTNYIEYPSIEESWGFLLLEDNIYTINKKNASRLGDANFYIIGRWNLINFIEGMNEWEKKEFPDEYTEENEITEKDFEELPGGLLDKQNHVLYVINWEREVLKANLVKKEDSFGVEGVYNVEEKMDKKDSDDLFYLFSKLSGEGSANESSGLSILATTEVIMSLMNKVEKQKGKMFYQLYPKLEDEIFAAIDSKNVARLSEMIRKLEDILDETINYSEEKNDMSLASEVLAMCNESDPSLKAPKKWWGKMQKSAMKQYKDEETARKVVGKIWTNLSDEKKEEIRGREGKHYGPAPECKESNNELVVQPELIEIDGNDWYFNDLKSPILNSMKENEPARNCDLLVKYIMGNEDLAEKIGDITRKDNIIINDNIRITANDFLDFWRDAQKEGNREGKHYSPAPECKESNNEIAELDKLQSELRLMREKTPVNKMSDEEYKKYKELADKVDKLIKDLYTVQSISKEKNVNETGEMSQADIEEEGEWYGVRLALETLCKDAGLRCKVKPFDKYQGCYAQLENGGKIWLGKEEGEYILELGKDTFEFSTADELEDLVKKENENMQSSLDKKLKELEDKKENNKTSKE